MSLSDLGFYELRARILVGSILALPFVVTAYFFKELTEIFGGVAGVGIGGITVVIVMGTLARHFGKQIEHQLWKSWGGPPSTRLVRSNDTTFAQEFKAALAEKVFSRMRIRLPSPAEELADPIKADRSIQDIFRQVRELLRQNAPSGLWYTHLAEYGFARNLFGSIIPLIILSLLCATICFFRSSEPNAPWGVIANFIIALIALSIKPFVRKHVEDCANRYAESAWIAFANLPEIKTGHLPATDQIHDTEE